jgi:hypothetical protein
MFPVSWSLLSIYLHCNLDLYYICTTYVNLLAFYPRRRKKQKRIEDSFPCGLLFEKVRMLHGSLAGNTPIWVVLQELGQQVGSAGTPQIFE